MSRPLVSPSALRRAGGAIVLLAAIVLGASAAVAADTTTTTSGATTTTSGITRTELGDAKPANAPGQELYLQRVTIASGAKLAEHFHEGTQVARVISGVLTYDIASGEATVTRADGSTQT